MMRRYGGYVPDASDESSGVAPTSVTALTPIECASCKLLRQRIEELEAKNERLRVALDGIVIDVFPYVGRPELAVVERDAIKAGIQALGGAG